MLLDGERERDECTVETQKPGDEKPSLLEAGGLRLETADIDCDSLVFVRVGEQ